MKMTAIAIAASLSLSSNVVMSESHARSLRQVSTDVNADFKPTSCVITDGNAYDRRNPPSCTRSNGKPGVCLKQAGGIGVCYPRRADCGGGFCECSQLDFGQDCISGKCSYWPRTVDTVSTSDTFSKVTAWSESPPLTSDAYRCEPAVAGSWCLSPKDCISRTCLNGMCASIGLVDPPTILTPCSDSDQCQTGQICANDLCRYPADHQILVAQLPRFYWESCSRLRQQNIITRRRLPDTAPPLPTCKVKVDGTG
eukprot:CAMPEP_0202699372 /NCGR_PEP_ID=MMETSP1385-20130828/12591_1 /ASSEMBLY_ACC=CAM_ASM_000861 /TAXON_ID=933848 /ORGANISM="Elphidium margaritaceum" /LENGTH=253 /DNA_ID=CAMNT_0049356295 /DNA_START=45 /DNA_END=803 /DNA_ORIENTATION=-